jgi:hypothetical protein
METTTVIAGVTKVTMGPQVRKLAAYKMAMVAKQYAGNDIDRARGILKDPGLIFQCLMWTLQEVASLKVKLDCPHRDDDEAIATDILDKVAELEAKGD